MAKKQLSLAAFALSLGQSDRLTHAASEPLHRAFKAADADGQAAMRVEFVTNFIAGRLTVTKAVAAKICDKARAGNKGEKLAAYKGASDKFGYHIRRTSTVASADELKGVFKKIVSDLTALRRLSRKLTASDARELRGEIEALLETYAVEE